jgi:hypothetical protein
MFDRELPTICGLTRCENLSAKAGGKASQMLLVLPCPLRDLMPVLPPGNVNGDQIAVIEPMACTQAAATADIKENARSVVPVVRDLSFRT